MRTRAVLAAAGVAVILSAAPAVAADTSQTSDDAAGKTTVNTFRRLDQPAEEPLAKPLPPLPDCPRQRSTGAKVGLGLGTVAGIAAGLLAADAGNDGQQVGAAVLGAAVGSTVGDLAGQALDPEKGCGTARTKAGPRQATREETVVDRRPVGSDTSFMTYTREQAARDGR